MSHPFLPLGPGRRAAGARRRPAGFTIFEVALAAAIMALGITTAINVLQRGFAMIDTARNITTAGQVLVSQMEQLRMYDWTTVSAYAAGPEPIALDTVFTGSSSVGNRFTLTRSVAAAGTDILQVTFTISWRNFDGRTLSREMTTYYARYGIHDYYYNHS